MSRITHEVHAIGIPNDDTHSSILHKSALLANVRVQNTIAICSRVRKDQIFSSGIIVRVLNFRNEDRSSPKNNLT